MTAGTDGRCNRPEMVGTFTGSPREIGTAFGEMHQTALQEEQAAWLERGAEHNVSRDDLLALAAPSTGVVEEIAPHWLEEASATAQAAGLDEGAYIAGMFYLGPTAQGGRKWFCPEPDECTSYTVSSDYTQGNRAFFHRTRDNAPRPQTGALWETKLPDVNRFMAVTYSIERSLSVFVNDRGLVSSGDQGGPPSTTRRDAGIMSGLVKRYVAERASSCEEALEIIEWFTGEGWYAGGKPGSRYTMADLSGTILDICHNSDPGSLTWRRVEGKSHITRTWEGTGDQMLQDLPEPVDFLAFRNIYRHPDARICRGRNSIAGMTVRVHPEFPDSLTTAWFSFPSVSLAFPLYMGGTGTPKPLMDGSLYELCADLPEDVPTWETIECSLQQNSLLLEARAETLLREGSTDEARQLIDDWTQSTCAAQLLLLEKSRE